MPQINGLISGLDVNGILDQLTTLAKVPAARLQSRVVELNGRISAWDDVTARLAAFKQSLADLTSKLSGAAKAESSDKDIIEVQAVSSARPAVYSVKVKQLARGEHSLSQGFSAADRKIMGSGTITLKAGTGSDDHDVSGATLLSALNNGAGFAAGSIKITDRSGAAAVIDLSGDLTVQDAMDAISGNSTVRVTASINEAGTGILIRDDTGSTNGPLMVEESGGTAAASLKILTGPAGVVSNVVKGGDLDPLYTLTVDGSNNTLDGLQKSINKLGGPFSAAVLYDGSSYRLSVASKNTGAIGALAITASAAAVSNEAVGTGDGSKGAAAGDYSLAFPVGAAAAVSSLTVGGAAYSVVAAGLRTGTGLEAEVNLSSGALQFFQNGTAVNVTGEILASYAPAAPAFTEIQTARDAEVDVGADNPVTLYSRTNILDKALPGVTLNLLDSDPGKFVEITVKSDIGAMKEAVSKVIDAYNGLVKFTADQNKYDFETQLKGGALFGDARLTAILDQITRGLIEPVDGLPADARSIFQIGVKAGEKGALVLDGGALENLLTTRLDDVKNIFNRFGGSGSDAVKTATSTAAGYDLADVTDGNVSSSDFGPDAGQGWMDDTPGAFPDDILFRFPTARYLTQALVTTVDSASLPAAAWGVRDYDLHYLRPGGDAGSESDWVFLASARGNTVGSLAHTFNAFAGGLRLRILGTNASDGRARLVELEAREASGLAARTTQVLSSLTDPVDGLIVQAKKAAQADVDRVKKDIENVNSRADREIARLQKQFAAMESLMSTMRRTGEILSAQLAGLTAPTVQN